MNVSAWKALMVVSGVMACVAGDALASEESSAPAEFRAGEELYRANCAQCHEGGVERAPHRLLMSFDFPPNRIYTALTRGAMQPIAEHLTDADKKEIVSYIKSTKFTNSTEAAPQRKCASRSNWFDYRQRPTASGWGMTSTTNSRFLPAEVAKLPASVVPRLKLKWAFAFPDATVARSQPAIAGGAIFVGDQNGTLYALDAETGCIHWKFEAEREIRTAISITDWTKEGGKGRPEPLLYFGDTTANAYAVNALTGKLLWRTKVDDGKVTRISGAPTLLQSSGGDRLFVPVSSFDANNEPDVSCCTFRGSVTALDAKTGRVIWKSYSIPTRPTERSKNARGVAQIGPSGAGIWNSPTIDLKRNRLYVGTAENHTSPNENGGAVLAMDLTDGRIVWSYQNYPGELYNFGCGLPDRAGCPEEFKGRYGLDIAASPILVTGENGKQIIVAGQKTGDVFGLDPDDKGRIVWRRRITRADYNLGVVYGMAEQSGTVVATVLDFERSPRNGSYWGADELGLYALDAFTGEPKWFAPASRDCNAALPCRGYSAAPTAIPGVFFAAAKDGILRAFDSNTGAVLWQTDTAIDFKTVDGQIGRGGDIDGPGPVVANGTLYVNSGYGTGNAPIKPGNVFLAFSVDGK